MKLLILVAALGLQACSMLPQSNADVDNAIKIKVEKNAISKDTDVSINVAVKNKDK